MSESNLSRRNFLAQGGVGLLAAATLPATTQLAPPDKQPVGVTVPDGKPRRAGWAIVGLGKLSIEQILPAFGQCEHSQVVALVSGHPDKARKLADRYGVDPKKIYDYGNYDSIANDPAVDIVYNVLPNHMHAEYTIRALKAGKHVLCEKPMAPTSAECVTMIDAAKAANRKLMIAYRLRYEPFTIKAIEVARSGELGKIKIFEAQNSQTTEAPNIRLSKQTAGGPLGDVGVYCLNASRYILGEEPVEVSAMLHQPQDDPNFAEVAESLIWQARFPSGALAICACGFGTERSSRLRASGDKGVLEMDPAFAYNGQQLSVTKGKETTRHAIEAEDHFKAEMDHFSQCVLNDEPPLTPGEEGLRDTILVEKIKEAAWTGKTIKLEPLPAALPNG